MCLVDEKHFKLLTLLRRECPGKRVKLLTLLRRGCIYGVVTYDEGSTYEFMSTSVLDTLLEHETEFDLRGFDGLADVPNTVGKGRGRNPFKPLKKH